MEKTILDDIMKQKDIYNSLYQHVTYIISDLLTLLELKDVYFKHYTDFEFNTQTEKLNLLSHSIIIKFMSISKIKDVDLVHHFIKLKKNDKYVTNPLYHQFMTILKNLFSDVIDDSSDEEDNKNTISLINPSQTSNKKILNKTTDTAQSSTNNDTVIQLPNKTTDTTHPSTNNIIDTTYPSNKKNK